MQNEKKNAQCMAILGSMTQAMRAQRVLANAAIVSRVFKVDASQSRRGCAFGVEYSCLQQGNVQTVLENAGVRVRSYREGDGE